MDDSLVTLIDTVWVGLSAGSMVIAPNIGKDFVGWKSPTGSDETLGVVDFAVFLHLDDEDLPETQ
jgi:dipeptidase E